VANGDRSDDNGDGLDEHSDNGIYRGSDAYVYNAFCASQNDIHAVYDASCANHDDHHILFCNDREHAHGFYDVPGSSHAQRIHQHLQITKQLPL
jgi:hypothetical protein